MLVEFSDAEVLELLTVEDFSTGLPEASYEVETSTLGSEDLFWDEAGAEFVALVSLIVDDLTTGRPYAS